MSKKIPQESVENLEGSTLPAGGTTDQALVKLSNADYDTGYVDILSDSEAIAEGATLDFLNSSMIVMTLTADVDVTAISNLTKGYTGYVRFKGNFNVTINTSLVPAVRVGDFTIRDNETTLIITNDSLDATPHYKVSDFYGSSAQTGALLQSSFLWKSADILQGSTNPLEIIPNPGAGKFIKLIDGSGWVNFNTTQYPNGTIIDIGFSFNSVSLTSSLLAQITSSYGRSFIQQGNAAFDSFVGGIIVGIRDANPVSGDSDIAIYVQYCIVDELIFPPYLDVPDAPIITTSLIGSDISVDITEGASNGGAAVTGWKIETNTDSAGWTDENADTGNTITPYIIAGLGNGTHQVRVSSINSVGVSLPSNIETEVISSVTSTYTTYAEPVGGIYGYGVSLPSDYSGNSNDYPVIFFFHGSGESGTDLTKLTANGILETSTLRDWYATKGFIIIAPLTSDTTDNWKWQANNVNTFVSNMLNTYRINPNKIFWTGLSAGAELCVYMTIGASFVTKALIEPAAVVPIAGAVGFDGSADMFSAQWFFRRESDSVAVQMDNAVDYALQDVNPQEVLFTQFAGSAHGGWDYVYKTGTNDSVPGEVLGTDPIPVGGGFVTNEPLPGISPNNTMADWMLDKARGGSENTGTATLSVTTINASSIDFLLGTTYAGHLYMKAVDANAPAPSNFDIYTQSDYDQVVVVGSQTVTAVGLPGGTKDIYCFVETDLYGTRARPPVIEDVEVPSFTLLRSGNLNLAAFGGTVTDPEWVNSSSTLGAEIVDMNDSTGAATTWDVSVSSPSGATSNDAGGTDADCISLGIPLGSLTHGRKTNTSGDPMSIAIDGLDDTKQYRVTLFAYHQYANREFTAQLESNAGVFANVYNNASALDLGIASPTAGALTVTITTAAGKVVNINALKIEEYS